MNLRAGARAAGRLSDGLKVLVAPGVGTFRFKGHGDSDLRKY